MGRRFARKSKVLCACSKPPSRSSPFSVAILLTGCGGGATHSVLPSQPVHSANAQQVTFKIDVPKTMSTTKKSPLYVSPATTQMAIDVQTGCPASCVSYTGYPVTQALTTTSGGCTSTLANTQCQLTLALPANSYTATLTTEDASGTALSTAQSIAFTVVAGTANNIPIVLSGIPAAIVTAAVSATSQAVIVNALDADNNIIVGSGAPRFTVSNTSGIALTLTQPTTTSPNVFTAVPAAAGTATLNVTASYSGVTDACAQSGAVCSATFTLTSAPPPLFVANNNGTTVTEYTSPYTGTPTTISNGIDGAVALTFDSVGNLFVLNQGGNGSVTEYASPYTGTPIATISNGTSIPGASMLDPSGNLFVAYSQPASVLEYAPPYTDAPTTTITNGLNEPIALVRDPSGNLFVADPNIDTVWEFAPPYSGTPTAITNTVSGPLAVALDSAGDLFVANDGRGLSNGAVTIYSSPYTDAPTTTITNGVYTPQAMVFDPSGNLFVANYGNNTVTEYAPPYTGAPTATISTGIIDPSALVLDASGNLFVANPDNNTVTEYAPPYTGAPTTISTGVNAPYGLVLGTYAISITP